MNLSKLYFMLSMFFVVSKCIDICRENQSYQSCIESNNEKCKWDNIRRLCEKTYDYQQGCNSSLNKLACIKQIGNALGELARCHFLKICEEIPNLKTEKCQNNLSKSGCLSILNPEEICYWKDESCHLLLQNQWNQVQKDFDSVKYSASACSLIENYLIIHNTILWELLSYSPNLFSEAEQSFKKEIGLEVDDDINYDDPNIVKLQNNYKFTNGSYAWYTVRESKTITLTNLQISYRYRDGCIAIEIENDNDFYNLFRITDERIGINHIYCKYLSRNPTITEQYVFSDGVCKKLNIDDFQDDQKILELGLNCRSFDYYQCIYFDSKHHTCRLKGLEQEYPCINQEEGYLADCESNFCTVKQCSKLFEHYMDTSTNRCSKSCSLFFLNTQATCEKVKGCKFLGTISNEYQKVCSPENGCDQLGIEKNYCKFLKDQCGWNEELQRCYRVNDQELKFMKCSQAFNIQSCVLVTLSDQICFWDDLSLECKNVLEQPILIAQNSIFDTEMPGFNVFLYRKISNENFCKYQQLISTEYDQSEGFCYFEPSNLISDLNHINSYSCLYYQQGYQKWDSQKQICLSFVEEDVTEFNCKDQVLVNEKICQNSKVQGLNFICIFDSKTSSCKELEITEIESFGCDGYGFSKEICISKKKPGVYCQFLAGQCKSISEEYINSIRCSSLQNVNEQTCRLYSSTSTVCLYDKSINSCYIPSAYSKIIYSQDINCYGCQQVQDSMTYFDMDRKECVQIDENNDQVLTTLECSSNYVNQLACLSITKNGQHCYWDTELKQCKNYSDQFVNCSDFINFTSRICQALVADMKIQFTRDKYCVYFDYKCQVNSSMVSDCGESEKMNIHRCSGLTGLNQAGEYIQMCAFIDNQCTALVDDSMDAYIILNKIQCSQANLKACTKIETNGMYCQLVDDVSENNYIIDKKCRQIDDTTQTCQIINNNFYLNKINPNHCSRAYDSCFYDLQNGCQTPINADLECDTPGLSYFGCIQYTQNRRCAFKNKKCQYLAPYQSISDCKYLNQFTCTSFQHLQCYWDGQICNLTYDYTSEYGSDYTCSMDTNNYFLVSNGSTCVQEQQSNYDLYNCDSKLNQFACGSFENQYCQFMNNQCEFYYPILCEDSVTQCGDNNSLNLKCVEKDGKCFNYPYTKYECDFFEKTNYEFCLQYPNCIYSDQKCQTIHQTQNYWYCYSYPKIKCVIQNKQHACSWIEEMCEDFSEIACPSLNGFHSYNACMKFENCKYGFTKSGLGFCYQAKNFDQLTCEQLNYDFCLEDLSHLNSSLLCYWDQSCKNIKNTPITTCEELLNYQSNYAACSQQNKEKCRYSFTDKRCKLIQEYITTTFCQGTTSKQCSQIKNTCYFNGSYCQISGLPEQLNKFGCINQQGTWKFEYFKCFQLTNEIQKTCVNLSKEACLSDLTKQLSCQWKNNKCQNVLEYENKKIISCQNLNQRSCQNIQLSNIQCIWNEEIKICEKFTMTNNDCILENLTTTTSISVCSSSKTKSCLRHYGMKKCAEIQVQLDSCSIFGLNQKACIEQTNVPCQWIQINEGGYCDDVNLYSALCSDSLNFSACQNIQTPGQACRWDESIKKCFQEIVTTCEAASHLRSLNACKSVDQEACYYDIYQQSCKQVLFSTDQCSNYYNSKACELSTVNCVWSSNSCKSIYQYNCSQYKAKSKCLESDLVNCQWLENSCVDFDSLTVLKSCIDLPININKKACQSNSLDPCEYDPSTMQCVAGQESNSNLYDWVVMSDLLLFQQPYHQSSLLHGTCEQLQNLNLCLKSRIQNKSCIWNEFCQEVKEFNKLSCTDMLNIWGCLNITKENQFCMWKDQKCQNWDSSQNVLENVNKNVCINFSINCVYENYSCVEKQIESILCESDGISKITCLSILNRSCQWTTSCRNFIQQHGKNCSDYQDVSIYVCQTILELKCNYDFEKNRCIETSKDVVGLGVSKQSCISNKSIATLWNDNRCQELVNFIECDSQLIVNELACRIKVKNTACLYDADKMKCKSLFNIWSLQCKTEGLNMLACVQVQSEPCIFKNNQCQQFTEFTEICMFINQVNSQACASVINQKCGYDSINYQCQTPFIDEKYCNVQGINKDYCNDNSLCLWNQDKLNCKCQTDQEIETCQKSSISECRSNKLCYFDLDIYKCVKKQCYHLKEDECNSMLDSKTCFISQKNGCQPASICEDIIDPKQPCQTIYINSQPCTQISDQCASITNYQYTCPYSDCSNFHCIFYYGACKFKLCDDYNSQDCQINEGCYLDSENNCKQLLKCSQINQEIYGEQVSNICNLSSVSGIKCNWQKYALLEDTEICTNQYCEMYGSSTTLCQGNEMNGFSCVLINSLVCNYCEQITESCFCNQQINTCSYQNGKCNSILCSSFLTKEKCSQASERCYWSSQFQQNIKTEYCVKQCEKIIDAGECNERINECYFENSNGLCVKGQKQIPNLSSDILIEEVYARTIQRGLIFLLIYFA